MMTTYKPQQEYSAKNRDLWFYVKPIGMAIVFAATITLSGCYDSETEQAPPAVAPPAVVSVVDDTLSVPVDTTGIVRVLGNDSTSSGGTLSINTYDVNSGNGGTVVHNGDGRFTYTPLSGFEGEDTFSYTAMDPDGTTASGTVTITVSQAVIPNGIAFYAANCAICHAAGQDDSSTAFRASDLAAAANELFSDLSMFGGQYELMGAFSAIPQHNIDELKAYIATLSQ